jgi:hypothetical protein
LRDTPCPGWGEGGDPMTANVLEEGDTHMVGHLPEMSIA